MKFLNIPFVRRHFHNFLSSEERRLWLSRQIRFGQIIGTRGLSSYPTFTGDREVIFVLQFDVSPRVGDVITFRDPNSADRAWAQKHPERKFFTKRIAGLEGYCGYMETVWRGGPQSKVTVPRGHCWVLGDNRLHSRDSRRFGPVPLVSVVGRVIWRLGPEAFNFIDHDPNYGAATPSQSSTSMTRQPIRPDADPKTPVPKVRLILKTIPPTITGPKPHLRYRFSDTKRQEPIDRSSSKRF